MARKSKSKPGSTATDLIIGLDKVPRWSDPEILPDVEPPLNGDANSNDETFHDPLSFNGSQQFRSLSPPTFPVDHSINSLLYLWKGHPWSLEIDAVVNSTNDKLEESVSSPGLHAAAGPGLAEECDVNVKVIGECRSGEARITSAYDLPARRVIHVVCPRYAPRFPTSSINSLSNSYRSCLEILIENQLSSLAIECIYAGPKGFPNDLAGHIAIRTVRRFLEKYGSKLTAVVLCTISEEDTELYRRLLPLYFPRTKAEEEEACRKLPEDTGDENGGSSIVERKIRINVLPGSASEPLSEFGGHEFPVSSFSGRRPPLRSEPGEVLDPSFVWRAKDPDVVRAAQWMAADDAQAGWPLAKLIGFEGLGGRQLTPAQQDSLHARTLAQAMATDLDDVAEMKIIYKGGRDSEGRPVMVVVGNHFLPRAMDVNRFVLYAVREFDVIMRRPFCIVYFHSDTHLPLIPDFGWMKRLIQVLGRPLRHNLEVIYTVHPSFGLRAAILGLHLFVDAQVWSRVKFVDRMLELFQHVPRHSMNIPDFVFQFDAEMHPRDVVGLESHITQRQGHRQLALGLP